MRRSLSHARRQSQSQIQLGVIGFLDGLEGSKEPGDGAGGCDRPSKTDRFWGS